MDYLVVVVGCKASSGSTVDCWPSRNRRLIIVLGGRLGEGRELRSVPAAAGGEGRVDLAQRHCLSLRPQGRATLFGVELFAQNPKAVSKPRRQWERKAKAVS